MAKYYVRIEREVSLEVEAEDYGQAEEHAINLFVENPVNTTESYHFNSSFCIKFSSDTRHNKNKNWVYESTSFSLIRTFIKQSCRN